MVAFQGRAGVVGAQEEVGTVPLWREDAAGEYHVYQSAGLAAQSVRGTPAARWFRVKWTVITAGAGYTFQVLMFPR